MIATAPHKKTQFLRLQDEGTKLIPIREIPCDTRVCGEQLLAKWRCGILVHSAENEGTATQMGAMLAYKFEVYCDAFWTSCAQARKRQMNINKLLFDPVALGTTPGLSQGQPDLSLGQPTLSQGQPRFVPGPNPGFLLILQKGSRSPVCPRTNLGLSLGHSRGRRTAEIFICYKFMCYVRVGGASTLPTKSLVHSVPGPKP